MAHRGVRADPAEPLVERLAPSGSREHPALVRARLLRRCARRQLVPVARQHGAPPARGRPRQPRVPLRPHEPRHLGEAQPPRVCHLGARVRPGEVRALARVRGPAASRGCSSRCRAAAGSCTCCGRATTDTSSTPITAPGRGTRHPSRGSTTGRRRPRSNAQGQERLGARSRRDRQRAACSRSPTVERR